MQDAITKAKGNPSSTSRAQEKANKKNTIKARRQAGKREIQTYDDEPHIMDVDGCGAW